jgi:hypothetical protein
MHEEAKSFMHMKIKISYIPEDGHVVKRFSVGYFPRLDK